MKIRTDFLVIGSGIAGLSYALKVAKTGRVAIISKVTAAESSSFYAQGGIASVLSRDDSFDLHVADTLVAGAGLCREDVVRRVVKQGPARIKELIRLGVRFTKSRVDGYNGFDLGKEGGHSRRRIVHAADLTGREVELALLEAVDKDRNIRLYDYHQAINLISLRKNTGAEDEECLGAYVLDKRSGKVHTFLAGCTLLATGGAGKIYRYTSNPDIATGDGIAMAYRVGARIANMEFVQFHPTCLFHPKAKNFLISEALRGEGGELRTTDGEPFMKRYHELGSLAPRDVVARAIDHELKSSGADSVFLDMTHLSKDFIEQRFPNIHGNCLKWAIDMTSEPIPVVPAAHYSCGGVQVGLFGETSVPGLMAIGEASCTGLHGANRLASNSLLEGAVYADRAADYARKWVQDRRGSSNYDIAPWDPGVARPSDEAVIIAQNWDEVRRFMWNYVGIVRTNRRLFRARQRINLLWSEIAEYYWNYTITSDLLELRNIATVARLIIESALHRQESRGLHYNLDYPNRDDKDWRRDTVLDRLMLEGHGVGRRATEDTTLES